MTVGTRISRNVCCMATILCVANGLQSAVAAGQPAPEGSAVSEPGAPVAAVIPRPAKLDVTGGVFNLTAGTRILTQKGSDAILAVGRYLAAHLAPATGWNLKVEEFAGAEPPEGAILLTSEGAAPGTNIDTIFGDGSYNLTVTPKDILLRGATPRGIFHGVQTIRQLLPPGIEWRKPLSDDELAAMYRLGPKGRRERSLAEFRKIELPQPARRDAWEIPCVRIEDEPRFRWRGLMLDIGRCFMPKEFVKRYIDLLAFHKMSVLRMHMTEEYLWTIEIKKYPKLAEIGAWKPNFLKQWADDPAGRARWEWQGGGYYTHDDIREIVAHAATRYVMIVPEIEIPSENHTKAMRRSYPEILECGGPRKGLCMGSEETFRMIEAIITELVELFPSPYFHVGGDEGHWSLCEKHGEKLGLERPDAAAAWKRVREFLASKNRLMVTWSRKQEYRGMRSPVFQYWSRHIDPKLMTEHIESGADIYVSPCSHCYLDYKPVPAKDGKPGTSTMKEFYLLEPIPEGLAPEPARHVLGGEDCMWKGSVRSQDRAIFPRICATAEALWTPKERRDFDDFMQRMKIHYERLRLLGVRWGASGMEP